ncbi:hypothetical protein FQZ97_907840 [compost metagenome]
MDQSNEPGSLLKELGNIHKYVKAPAICRGLHIFMYNVVQLFSIFCTYLLSPHRIVEPFQVQQVIVITLFNDFTFLQDKDTIGMHYRR